MVGMLGGMTSWGEIERREPVLAARVRGVFDRYVHKTMATLRKDGSPRISATEVDFFAGEAWIGSMGQARKTLDLWRDPRVAIHSGTADPEDIDGAGDAKITGRVVAVTNPALIAMVAGLVSPGPVHLFRLDVDEIVATDVGDPEDYMVVDYWTASAGRRTVKRPGPRGVTCARPSSRGYSYAIG